MKHLNTFNENNNSKIFNEKTITDQLNSLTNQFDLKVTEFSPVGEEGIKYGYKHKIQIDLNSLTEEGELNHLMINSLDNLISSLPNNWDYKAFVSTRKKYDDVNFSRERDPNYNHRVVIKDGQIKSFLRQDQLELNTGDSILYLKIELVGW